ncbi:MAG: hypothetical protein CVT90_01900 [Candidatus Altiarchaeales archaeon HGW-Altiarchaeales-3]|nr:MAG: hypothetical protein CVT90_01900 [Candidatus Altiarchaeales archaeon HGW-Altiarchaeales-3]
MIKRSISQHIPALIIICGVIIAGFPGVLGGNNNKTTDSGMITFALTDIGDYSTINRVSLMRTGEYSKDGRVHQYQNISFNRNTHELTWTPCNNNDCSYASFPTSGGNNGRDELILEIFLDNPTIDTSSCYGNPTCEHLKGGSSTKSGVLNGIFKTGKNYEISVGSLKAGIGQQFTVTESMSN